jgi:hypothetical protein
VSEAFVALTRHAELAAQGFEDLAALAELISEKERK